MSRFSHLSTPDSEWLKIASKLRLLPAHPGPLDILRRQRPETAIKLNELWDNPKPGLQVADVSVPVQGASIVVTYVPTQDMGGTQFPVFVWFHGGGFMLGDLEMDDGVRGLSFGTRTPLSDPLQDCYDALKWVVHDAQSISADLMKGLIVGSSSAGAYLATVVALKAQEDPLLKGMVTGQVLQMPTLCSPSVYPEQWRAEFLSMDQNKDAPLLGLKMLRVFTPLASPNVAPLLVTTRRTHPPTYLQIPGLYPMGDEGLLYEKALRESGVPTKVDVYPGLLHGFWLVDPLTSSSTKLSADIVSGVKWLPE
ncbi:Alpha/Beta hydrolase protein [Gautieria morchelliformis]|nr:Alpha/Beta hydrolase protein [Gautieria morchelliformis]